MARKRQWDFGRNEEHMANMTQREKNIIRYVCWIPQRREAFIRLCQHSQPDELAFLLITANLTQWYTDFLAIWQALQLWNPLELFIARKQRSIKSWGLEGATRYPYYFAAFSQSNPGFRKSLMKWCTI